jgi:nucleoside-diphosphate-sugar epimerase
VSVLLAGLGGTAGEAVVERLVGQGDDVRVIERDPTRASLWARRGAHVARGDASDADLVERAAQHVRTVVVMEHAEAPLEEVLEAVVEGTLRASPQARVIVCARDIADTGVERLRASGMEHVVLRLGSASRHWAMRARRLSDALVAEAIDAADDVAFETRLDLDLANATSWAALGLSGP